jgi:TraG P-loop domain
VTVIPFRRRPARRAPDRGVGMLGPDAVEVAPATCASATVRRRIVRRGRLPAEVSAGWLEPLITYPGRLDITLHIEPIPPVIRRRPATPPTTPALALHRRGRRGDRPGGRVPPPRPRRRRSLPAPGRVLRDLPDELKAVGTLLTLDAVWRQVTDPAGRRRRLVVVDEAWLLLRDGEGAKFLYRLAKSARKHWAGLTVVTQDAADALGSDLGQAVVANAATQVLLRQAPQAIDTITEAFHLSAGERQFLRAANRGQGLLAAGSHRVGFEVVASDIEHRLVTTDPQLLAALEAQEANWGVGGPGVTCWVLGFAELTVVGNLLTASRISKAVR